MDQLFAMRIYRCLVEAKGFSAAAARLDTTHSTVSRQLKLLEASLGVQLVNRNTRNFTLTAAGERYYAACMEILDRVEAAAEDVAESPRKPSGTLRVSMPLSIGTLEMPDWLPSFRHSFPDIRLDVSCSDRFSNLVSEGFDVALRISGELPDSELMARTLAVSDEILVASPDYIAHHGLPRTPAQLATHELLPYSGREDSGNWRLTPSRGTAVSVKLDGYLRIDTITAIHASAVTGLGIGAFTHLTVRGDIERGRLVHVLPRYTLAKRKYYALYPKSRHVSPKVRAFIDFVADLYGKSDAR
ncbi:LysR family transcriptional regulator [Burkholderia ubonensis]|uniref:LysR family transcriptional regulator n=1 Tax=Burkholderia ubonensis TaxID=101571 RepID=UPI000757273A|nr:LysR family transcriptional regulator [Burkholderia ubonensis]KVZ65801.1 LysR family transcriptional regulator [Burkholderia ubonensis]OJA62592.1 LysR family transcriptional regulator [Burkholderia ubonensis]